MQTQLISVKLNLSRFHLSLLLNFFMCVLMEFRKWFAVGLSIEISVIFLKYTNVLLSFTFCLNLCGNKPSSTQFSCDLWYKYRFMVQIKCMHLMQKFWHLEDSTVEMLIVLVLLVTYIWYVRVSSNNHVLLLRFVYF